MDINGNIIKLPVPWTIPLPRTDYDESALFPGATFVPAPDAGFRTAPTNYEAHDNSGKLGRQMQATVWFLRYNHIPKAGQRAINDAKHAPMSAIYQSQEKESEEWSKRWQNAMISVEQQKNKADKGKQPREEFFFTRLVIGHITTHNYYAHLHNLSREIQLLRFTDDNDSRSQRTRDKEKREYDRKKPGVLMVKVAKWTSDVREEEATFEEGWEQIEQQKTQLFVCPHQNCDKAYRDRKDLVTHSMKHLLPVEKLPQVVQATTNRFVCGTNGCKSVFESKVELIEHRLGHEKLSCTYQGCSATYLRKIDLMKHLAKHETPKVAAPSVPTVSGPRYFCPATGCGKSYSQKSGLRRHLPNHLDDGAEEMQRIFCEYEKMPLNGGKRKEPESS